MIKPNFLDLDLEDSDIVNNEPVVSTIIDNVLLPNGNFYEICSQWNEGQQHLLSFPMQHALHCILAEKSNELPPKPFEIFLNGGADVEKSILIKTVTEYLK